MFSSDFKDLQEQINPSDELLLKTKLAMKQQLQKPAHSKFKLISHVSSVAACLALIVITAYTLTNHPFEKNTTKASLLASGGGAPTDISDEKCEGFAMEQDKNQIKATLQPDEHQDTVALLNGELVFTPFDPLPKELFGLTNPQTGGSEEFWLLSQVVDYLGADPTPAYLPETLTCKYPSNLVESIDGNESSSPRFLVENTSQSTQLFFSFTQENLQKDSNTQTSGISITVAKNTIPVGNPSYQLEDAAKSTMNGTTLSVWHFTTPQDETTQTKAYDSYVAKFLYHDIGYFIEAKNLTQEEFIYVLLSIIV